MLASGNEKPRSPPLAVSLVDLLDLERHFQKRELALLLFLGAGSGGATASTIRRSAQYPSGNQTYSNPSRGGRGGSTPNKGGGGRRAGMAVVVIALVPVFMPTGPGGCR